MKKRVIIFFICTFLIGLTIPVSVSYAADAPRIDWISRDVGYSIDHSNNNLLLKSGITLETLQSEEDPDNIDTNYSDYETLTFSINGKNSDDFITNGDGVELTGTFSDDTTSVTTYGAIVIDGLNQLTTSDHRVTVDLENPLLQVKEDTTVDELKTIFSGFNIVVKENDSELEDSSSLSRTNNGYQLTATEVYDGKSFEIPYDVAVYTPVQPTLEWLSDEIAYSLDKDNQRILLKENILLSDLKNDDYVKTNGSYDSNLFEESIELKALDNESPLSNDAEIQTGNVIELSVDGERTVYDVFVISTLNQLDSSDDATRIDYTNKRIEFINGIKLSDLTTDLNLSFNSHYYDNNNKVEITDDNYVFDQNTSYKILTTESYHDNDWVISYHSYIYEPTKPKITWLRNDIGHLIDQENNRLLIRPNISVSELTSDENPDHIDVNDDAFSDPITFEVKNSNGEVITGNTVIEEGSQVTLLADGMDQNYTIYISEIFPKVTIEDDAEIIDTGNYLWVPFGMTQEGLQSGTTETFTFQNSNDSLNHDDQIYYTETINGNTWTIKKNIKLDIGFTLPSEMYSDHNQNIYQVNEKTDISELITYLDNYISEQSDLNSYVLKLNDNKVTSGLMSIGEFYKLMINTELGDIRYYLEAIENNGSNNPNDGEVDTVSNAGNIKTVNLSSEDNRVLFRGNNDGYLYLKSQETLSFNLEALDVEYNPVDLTTAEIDLTHQDAHGDDLDITVVDKNTIQVETPGVQGGYGDDYLATLSINDFRLYMKIKTYKGSLGVIQVKKPDGSDYPDAQLGYAISYEFEDANGNTSGDGSNTGGDVINGELMFPIRTDYVNLNYAYIVADSSDSTLANSEVVDLTNEFNVEDSIIEFDTTIDLQTPSFTGTLKLSDGSDWYNCIVGVSTENGDDQSPIQFVDFSLFTNDDNTFALASIGDSFGTTYNIDVRNTNNIGLPVDTSIDIENDTQKTITSGIYQLSGQLLMPDGETKIPSGSGRDSAVYFKKTDETTSDESSGYRNTGAFEVNGLEDGEEYEMYVHLDLGDFDDYHITDGLRYTFTYDATGDTLQVHNPYTETVETFDKSNFDLQVAPTQLMGQVFKGSQEYNEMIGVNLYDMDRQFITSDTTHSSKQMGLYGIYNLGSLKEDLSGEYYLEVEAPQDTIEYSGFIEKVTLPKNDSDKYNHDLNLKETRVSGEIIAPGFSDSYQRVYVNIFDEYGNYIKNGRVRSDGMFAVGNLAPGRYLAKAFVSSESSLASSYLSSDKIAFEVEETGSVLFDLPLIELMSTESIENYQSGTWVRVFDENMNEIDALSTDHGSVKIPKYDDGQYFFKAYGPEHTDSLLVRGTINHGSLTLNQKLTLDTTIDLSITLEDSEAGEVIVYDSRKNFLTFGHTENSQIDFTGLSSDEYFIKVIPDSDTLCETSFIPITLPDDKTKSISLTASDVTGRVLNATSGWVYVLDDQSQILSVNKINADGSFMISNLLADETYTIYAESTEGYPSVKTEITKETETIDLSLRSEASIKGRLSEDTDKVNIYLYDESNRSVAGTQINDFGEFYFMDISDGSYTLVVQRENQSDYSKTINLSNTLDLGTIDMN